MNVAFAYSIWSAFGIILIGIMGFLLFNQKLDIPFIDPLPQFQELGFEATHFIHDGHWSATGHRLAAEETATWLRAHLTQ